MVTQDTVATVSTFGDHGLYVQGHKELQQVTFAMLGLVCPRNQQVFHKIVSYLYGALGPSFDYQCLVTLFSKSWGVKIGSNLPFYCFCPQHIKMHFQKTKAFQSQANDAYIISTISTICDLGLIFKVTIQSKYVKSLHFRACVHNKSKCM